MLKRSDFTPSFIIFTLTVLASVGFFNFHGILSDQLIKLLLYIFTAASVFMAFTTSERSLGETNCHAGIYILMLTAMCFSGFMAYTQHSQPLITSAVSLMPFVLMYGYFFVMLKFNFEPERIMRLYIALSVLSAVVYFINVATVPNNMFGEPIINEDFSRGIIRIPVVFIEMMPLLVFYAINKWNDTNKKIWFVLMGFASLMIFLSVIRQVIALTAVLGFWFLFRKLSIYKKLLLIVGALVMVVYVLPIIPVYRTMIELSEDQRDENDGEENIRIQAWRFYTYENQENVLTAIFGNGVPSAGNGTWGTIFDSEAEVTGMFTHDVGWAGYYFFFGIISTVALILVLLFAFFKPKPAQYQFLNYWIVFLVITSVASGPLLYYWQILDIAVVLGMIYYSAPDHILSPTDNKDDNNEEDCIDNTKLQQFPRYPQLH